MPKTQTVNTSLLLPTTGKQLSGDLDLDGNKITNLPAPTEAHHSATKKYTDDADNLELDKAGDAMTGPLGMSGGKIWDLGAPTLDSNATNKKYVEDADNLKLNKAGSKMTGDLDMSGNKIVKLDHPTDSKDASNKMYVDTEIATLTSTVDGKLAKTGGTLSGVLNMGSNNKSSLASPTSNADAATKNMLMIIHHLK